MSKQFWAVVVAIVIVLIGVFVFTNNNKTDGSSGSSSSTKPSQHIEGEGKDGVTLVEYGDYECPYCGEYYATVKQVQSEYNTQMTFQFRNFPLVSIHQNAFAGARAAEAASMMGKFWQMHDLLYENQNQWAESSDPTTYFDQYAQQLGLNLQTFKTDYASDHANNVINADMAAGNKLGVDATPTFYLDGKEIQVANSQQAFETLINAAIAQKTGHAASSSTPTSSGTTAQTKE